MGVKCLKIYVKIDQEGDHYNTFSEISRLVILKFFVVLAFCVQGGIYNMPHSFAYLMSHFFLYFLSRKKIEQESTYVNQHHTDEHFMS